MMKIPKGVPLYWKNPIYFCLVKKGVNKKQINFQVIQIFNKLNFIEQCHHETGNWGYPKLPISIFVISEVLSLRYHIMSL